MVDYNLTDKLIVRGPKELTDAELLAMVIDSDAEGMILARSILLSYSESLTSLALADISRLRMVEGVGLRRAQRIIAAIELGKRCASAILPISRQITNCTEVVDMFRPMMAGLDHEECWVLYLNSSNRVVEQMRVSQGGITTTTVDHRLIIKRALELLATQLIIVHNHPSGSIEPSEEDVLLTYKIKSAAELFDISLLDHIIISASEVYSFFGAELI